MQRGISTVERAFQLAQSGRFTRVDEIKRELNREGHRGKHICGRLLMKQLNEALIRAQTTVSEATPSAGQPPSAY